MIHLRQAAGLDEDAEDGGVGGTIGEIICKANQIGVLIPSDFGGGKEKALTFP